MKTLTDMTSKEAAAYLQLLGAATSAVLTPDAAFVLVLSEMGGQRCHMTSNIPEGSQNRSELVKLLRAAADKIEKEGCVHERN